MMDTYPNRANTILYTFGQCFCFFAVLCHLSAHVQTADPVAGVSHSKTVDLTLNSHFGADQSTLAFNLDIDLTSEFNWNTNLIFAMVIASYETPSNTRNEVCIWDKIMLSKEDARINQEDMLIKYPLRDQFKHLKARDVTLDFRYQVIPNTGILYNRLFDDAGKDAFRLPVSYFRAPVANE
eukprot:GEMP01112388.1.p1 GENE.GEMP01112388.1~~GEMP01112388.1.p1  ORF type:complete len:181 (-),score=33.48 GEMP01112388.1:50-592(-)